VLAASTSSPAALADADSKAILASRLDPLSDSGLIAQAEIDTRVHGFRAARSDLLAALRRDPVDVVAWAHLINVEYGLHDDNAILSVTRRILELHPVPAYARFLTSQVSILLAPPTESPTAVTTPLPTG
jgi:hypothetical protein